MARVLRKPAETYRSRGRLDPEGFRRHIRFRTIPPPPDLAGFVQHAWVVRWEGLEHPYDSHEVHHRPYVDVFLSAGWSGIQGTYRGKRIYVAAGSGRILGVRLRPGAIHALWEGKASDLRDREPGIQTLFPRAGREWKEKVLALEDDEALAAMMDQVRALRPRPDPYIDLLNGILDAVERDPALATVSAVAKAYGRSERWLQQFFRDYTGIGLKWQLQRNRLLAAVDRIRGEERPDWAGLAYALGYSSQQYFITAFKSVIGKTPAEYKRASAGEARR